MSLNQRVPGSSPGAPTNEINDLAVKGVDVEYQPKQNRATTLAELMQFVRAADGDGTPSLGTAAMIAFYWLVREEDVFSRMGWWEPLGSS